MVVKVELNASLASDKSVWEKGDIYECKLPEARRLIARGLAKELPESPLPVATAEEKEVASHVLCHTKGAIPGVRSRKGRGTAKGNWAEYLPGPMPVRTKKAIKVSDLD